MNYESEFECYSAIVCIKETLQEIMTIMGVELKPSTKMTFDSCPKSLRGLVATEVRNQNMDVDVLEFILKMQSQFLDTKELWLKIRENDLKLREENHRLKHEQ